MIRMGKYQMNARGQVSLHEPEEKSADEILREVKRVRHDLISAHGITDDEHLELIKKIKGGTRNIRYLAVGEDYPRLKDVAAYIVREYN